MHRIFGIWLLLLLFFINGTAISYASNDKSKNYSILAADKKNIELLLKKADNSATVRNDSCLIYAQEALRLSSAYNSLELQGKALKIISNYYFDKEQYQEVVSYARRLISVYKESGDSINKASAHLLYGLANYNIGIYDEAIKSYYSCMQLAIDYEEDTVLATCYQNIGVLYSELDRPKEAMEYYKKALDLFRIQKDKMGEAGIMQNIGIIYDNDKKYRESLGYYLSALRVYESLNDSISMAMMYLNIGSSYEEQALFSRSLQYYNKSLAISLKENYKYGIAYSYYSLGSVCKKTRQYEKALQNILNSLQYSKMISLAENEADCHNELADIYFALGDYKSAYEEMREYDNFHDSLYNEQVHGNLTEIEMKIKTRLKDEEIENLRNERQKAIRDMIRRTIGLASIVILTIIIIVVSMYYSRSLKKANSMLTAEVDERIRAEKELINIKENLEDRVIQRTQELEKAKLKAEESDRLKSAFIANMSHEIRTPLNAITGFSGLLLRDDITPEKKKEYNNHVIRNNKILVKMIEDLIDTSKIESGNLQLHPSHTNIRQFLYGLNEPVINNLTRKNKTYIDVILDDPDIRQETILTDPVRLGQVMWHFLDNSVKFTEKGAIHYGCREKNDFIVFYVEDSGIGIPYEQKEVIFEKFRQLDESAKRKYGGTGLGLYYAKKIADMMGGKIWFDSKETGGSVFYFSVPKNVV